MTLDANSHIQHIATRRRFIVGAGAIAGGAALAGTTLMPSEAGAVIGHPMVDRKLFLKEIHTGERLSLSYTTRGRYVPSAMRRLNHFLRDWRTGDVTKMDPRVIDILHDVSDHFGHRRRIEIISGYRSPKTNAMLAKRSNGVAKKSYHLKGQAIDFRIPGISVRDIQAVAERLSRGGVGLYTRSGFVHVDCGPVRTWGS